jgi:hypothetical protein
MQPLCLTARRTQLNAAAASSAGPYTELLEQPELIHARPVLHAFAAGKAAVPLNELPGEILIGRVNYKRVPVGVSQDHTATKLDDAQARRELVGDPRGAGLCGSPEPDQR